MIRAGFVFASCVLATVLHAQQAGLPAPPGQLIDIGGRKLHAICTGQGLPTVVLEAGASSFAIDWTLVQREIARTNRVCAYDRAGMGWSDPPMKDERSSSDLHRLLLAAKEPPPYVLVGASRGGLMARTYALDYPDDVAGLVFVDPSSEDRLFTMVDGQVVTIASATPEQLKKNAPRLDERLIASVPETVPAAVVGAAQESERAYLARLLASRAAATHPLGGRPTVVLSRGTDPNADREAAHAAIAALSTNWRHTVVAGAGHEIHLFEPAAVVQAIWDVVQSVRTRTPLARR